MKILIVHKHTNLTGVSTFLYTIAKKMIDQFIDVDFYFYDLVENEYTCQLREIGVTILNEFPKDDYNQVFFNYASTVSDFYHFESEKKFFVHGLMDQDYKVPKGIDKVYTFGERSQNYISHPNKKMIRNGIDIERYTFNSNINYKPEKILLFDSRTNAFFTNLFLSVCKRTGSYFNTLGQDNWNKNIWEVEDVIKTSDLVIGYGRSVYESMAIGRPCIVYGLNGGDGIIDSEQTFLKMLETNCSGWTFQNLKPPYEETPDNIVREIEKYSKSHSNLMRELVEKYLDIDLYIDDILN